MNTEGLLDDNERSISGKSVSIWGNFWGFQRFVGKYRTFWDLSILFKSLGKISKKFNIGKQMTFRWPPLPWVGLICLICLFTTEVSCSLREPHWLPEWVILHLTSIIIGKSYLGENNLKINICKQILIVDNLGWVILHLTQVPQQTSLSTVGHCSAERIR